MRTLSLIACLFLLALLAGCGGQTASHLASRGSGRATVTILWPTQGCSGAAFTVLGRLIPASANSIVVQIQKGTSILASQTLARPSGGGTSTVAFANLPVGTLTAAAIAYPTNDGTGTPQAQASTPLAIAANQNTPFTLTLASTIDHLEIAPSPATVQVGQSLPLTITAKDATGAIVLISPSKLQWSPANTTASVDASGNLSGLTTGTTSFSVAEQEAGKSAIVNVSVTDSSTSTPISITGFNRDVIIRSCEYHDSHCF